ncbi:TonB-dependent receptor [Steroidobacter cummioxidans]|uniref:TonB-dependent receptor n=1 Tax=Steroidobacter cummioxidans TaxID=1803913 RepID=UPI000E312167|nr:TonB-dependent receptor [Steroidobacter cummioxidans]
MKSSELRGAITSSMVMASLLCADPGVAQDSLALEGVVVTASKRAERLVDVPAAIDTLSGDTLEKLGAGGFSDFAELVPNLDQRSAGAPGAGTVIIRGLNSGPQQTTSTVGFYLDDVPFTASGSLAVGSVVTPDPDLADIDSIEVLKGPQGTLYGASSLGGLIRIISKRPDLAEFSGSASMSGSAVDGGGTGHGMRASLNAPISQDRIGLRLSAFHRRDPGFVTNTGTGSEDVNDATVYGGRLSLLSAFGETVDLLLAGFYQKIEAGGFSYQDHVTDTMQPAFGPRTFSNYFDPTYEAEYQTLSATLNWTLGPGVLTSTLAYGEYQTQLFADYTQIYGPALAEVLPVGTGLKGDPSPQMEKTTVEIRYASERIDAFEFIAGLFHTDERNSYPIAMTAENQATGAVLPAPFGNVLTTVTRSDYREQAAFANLTYYFTDAVDLTLGARYAQNDQKAAATRSGLLLGVFVPTTSGFAFDDHATTYLATLRWRLTPALSSFVRAASGYRPGGPQTNSLFPDARPFEADTVWNYEVGVKGSFPERRVGFSASVYHIVWDDIQLNTLRGGFVFQGNGGKGEVNGFELEAHASLIDHLSVALSLGYNDTEIVSIDAESSASLGAAKGDPFPLSPKWGGALMFDYRMPLVADWVGTAGVSVKYTGERPSSFSNTVLNPNVDLPDYTTLDLRAGLENGPWRLALRVDNVTNEAGLASFSTDKLFAGQFVPSTAILIRPRTYGLTLSMDF